MGRLVALPSSSEDPDTTSIDFLVQQVMREARRRTGLGPGEFADAINERSARHPGLGPTAILAYESGDAIPLVDVYFGAIGVAGFPVRDALRRFLGTDGDAATTA